MDNKIVYLFYEKYGTENKIVHLFYKKYGISCHLAMVQDIDCSSKQTQTWKLYKNPNT